MKTVFNVIITIIILQQYCMHLGIIKTSYVRHNIIIKKKFKHVLIHDSCLCLVSVKDVTFLQGGRLCAGMAYHWHAIIFINCRRSIHIAIHATYTIVMYVL